MLLNLLMFTNLMLYSVLFSQTMFYLLTMRRVLLGMSANNFIETRHLLDRIIGPAIQPVFYGTLLSSLVMVLTHLDDPSGIVFITAIIAFILLIADVVITLRGNKPLNQLFNTWTPENYPADWQRGREAWLRYFGYRQVVSITGFICLLAGAIFK